MKKILTLALIFIASITLVACGGTTDDGELTDAEKVEEARAALLLGGLDQVKADMNLPTAGRNDTTITWESSNPSVISNTGEVTRPEEGEGNVEVTLTATITLNDESATREFTAVVIQEEPSSTFDTVAELHESASKNDVVEFQGVVSSVFNGGYFLTDGLNVIGIYGQIADEVNVGDEIYVKGTYDSYYTLFQLTDITVEDIVSTGNPVNLDVTPTTIAELLSKDSSDKLIHGQHYNIVGNVELRGDYDNVAVFIGDYALTVYYQSPADSIAALEAVVGETISIDVVYYTDHSADGLLVVFQGGASDITLEADFDGEQTARLAASYLNIGDLETTTDFVLPSEIADYGATVTWSTSDASVVTAEGLITRDEENDLDAVLTATVTVGSDSYDIDFPIVVVSMASENATPITIAEALLLSDDEEVLVQGVVLGLIANNTVAIQDETGGIALYGGTHANELADLIGHSVEITGYRDSYNGLLQIGDYTYEDLGLAEELPETFDLQTLSEWSETSLVSYQSTRVSLSDLQITSRVEDSYGNIEMTLLDEATGNSIDFKWDSRVELENNSFLLGTEVGDYVSFDGAVLGWSNGPLLTITNGGQINEGSSPTQ